MEKYRKATRQSPTLLPPQVITAQGEVALIHRFGSSYSQHIRTAPAACVSPCRVVKAIERAVASVP